MGGGASVPGPSCSTRVGDDWIDGGTSCLARMPAPAVPASTPEKARFDAAHAYSLAPEARRKRAIDLEIIGGDYAKTARVALTDGNYLKRLIEIASGGVTKVQTGKGTDMQFFVVRGGGEGFLPDSMRNIDASERMTNWVDTNKRSGSTGFDENDILAVFDADGSFVGAARLMRPTFVDGHLSRKTAAKVYDAWDRKIVSVYHRARAGWIPYLGLAVADGYRDGAAGRGTVTVDIHKTESTNGCILIVDPGQTDFSDAALRTFEPKLILDILARRSVLPSAVGGSALRLGVMRTVKITF